MAVKQRKRLGEYLQEWGAVTAEGVNEAVAHMLEHNCRIGEAMVALDLVDEEDIAKALAVQYDMEYVDMNVVTVSASDMALIPDEMIKRYQVLPIGRDDQGRLQLAVTDPLSFEAVETVQFKLNGEKI
ncbi:MAG: hypothetical protein HN909_00975, partial [Phycisphaerales bacterium]|nr:hypothetical protein [Phycisphaerales bacterium]